MRTWSPLATTILAITLSSGPALSQPVGQSTPSGVPMVADETSDGARFMLSARLAAQWVLAGSDDISALLAPVGLPRFLIGVQMGEFGLAIGLSRFSLKDTYEVDGDEDSDLELAVFMFGPTVTYEVARTTDGRAGLHLLGSIVFGTGRGDYRDQDVGVLGFDLGVVGRAMVVDALGFDVGLVFDYTTVTSSAESYYYGDDFSSTRESAQVVGFLGGTFLL